MNSKNMLALLVGLVLVVGVGLFVVSANDDDDDADDNATANVSESAASSLPFNFAVNNLAPLESSIYEGWVVRGDDKYSFGTFNTNEAGAIVGDLALSEITPENGDKVVVTIEPIPDNDPGPSPTVILTGDLANGSADLAFPVDVSDFSGEYILATPTNGDGSNETAGVWFLSLAGGSPAVGLNIPDAPDGWAYEGWVVYNGTPLTSGQFLSATGFDEFDGFSGPEPGPAFPGEDYLENLPAGTATPVDLANGTTKVVISLEPRIDGADPTGEGPAQVKPLVADVAQGAADHETFQMTLDTTSLPSGSASL